MEKDISLIMNLASCDEETAKKAYSDKNGDVLLAIDSILFGDTPINLSKKRKREDINEHEEYLNSMRTKMEEIDVDIQNHRSTTTTNPLDCEESVEMQDHHEEMVQQNSCLQECQIPSMEEVGRTRETECPLPPVRSCDSR